MKSPPPKTPEGSPSKRPMLLTQRQKQALIDDLQLEITERARRLRAQCNTQAHHLRTRIELRVNRVPISLRSVKMGELLEKHTEQEREKRESDPPLDKKAAKHATAIRSSRTKTEAAIVKDSALAQQSRSRGTKRTSNTMLGNDKENMPEDNEPLANPKKRVKATAKPTTTTKAPSRQITNPQAVLSPKSSNQCNLPTSILRSPHKSMLPRPESPLKKAPHILMSSPTKAAAIVLETAPKPIIAVPAEKPKAVRGTAAKRLVKQVNDVKAALARPKRGAGATSQAKNRTVSNSTTTSTGTTIMKSTKKPVTKAAPKKPAAPAKKALAVKAEAPATVGRVLRKRV